MEPYPATRPLHLTSLLTRDSCHQIIHTLREALSPVTDAAEDLSRRDNAAIAQVASLLPASADEAYIAAQYIAARAGALDCLQRARLSGTDNTLAMKWSALATGMMRQANSTRNLLLRVQAARRKREADPAATDKAAALEHCITGLMADAIGRAQPASEAAPVADPVGDLAAAAEQYAIDHPRRVALIRSLGGLPEKCHFVPPSDALLHTIVTGTTPHLRALDRPESAVPAAA